MAKEMVRKKINVWLNEGNQSKITPKIKEICSKFKGDDLEKIFKILNWIDKNLFEEKSHKKVLKIFASRTADQLIKQKNETGCHDTTLVLVTFLRAIGIPSKYLVGIDKISPTRGGHCVVEAYFGERWILIDPCHFKLNLIPSRSSFYKHNYLVKEGLDSWDCGIKTLRDWENTSNNLVEKIDKGLIKR